MVTLSSFHAATSPKKVNDTFSSTPHNLTDVEIFNMPAPQHVRGLEWRLASVNERRGLLKAGDQEESAQSGSDGDGGYSQ